MMKFRNKGAQGSILQIVLVILMVMTVALSVSLSLMKFQSQNYHMIDLMMKEKNLEIMLLKYYTDQMENDILFSESYENDDYVIESMVDNMGSYYEITTEIQSSELHYYFIVQIALEDYQVLKIEYKEG